MPTGIFDRTTVGQMTPLTSVDLERGRIAFFARAVGETNRIHHEVYAAHAAGYPDIVAPLTFPIAIRLDYERQLAETGIAGAMQRINCDFRRLLHGAERYEYFGPLFAGDRVEITTIIASFEDKKGGALELAHLETTISHRKRGVVIKMTSTAIHRLG